MKRNDKVEVIHKAGNQRLRRRTVGLLLDTTTNEVVLSLRPQFGTTQIRWDEIKSITVVPGRTAIVASEIMPESNPIPEQRRVQ